MNRDEFRKIKSFSKEEMERWLSYDRNMVYNTLRKEFNDMYKDELDSSVQNFLVAIAYTLHFNEDLHLTKDELASFMSDLFVSVELFRKGEYNPKDYEDQLKEDGITFDYNYDYSKLYREKDTPHKNKCDAAIKYINDNCADDENCKRVKTILEDNNESI